jgi:hypothetical protein
MAQPAKALIPNRAAGAQSQLARRTAMGFSFDAPDGLAIGTCIGTQE